MFEAAWACAVDIESGARNRRQCTESLMSAYSVAERTATAYFDCCIAMWRGKVFKSTVSAGGLRYLLQRISQQGDIPLLTALAAAQSHIEYLESLPNGKGRRTKESGLRRVCDEFLHALKPSAALYDSTDGFELRVGEMLRVSPERRAQELSSAPDIPSSIIVLTRIFKRSPAVVAEVLLRAKGTCEGCGRGAPFIRNDGSPYLEVHHRHRLADGGRDTIDNALALCPNCHRERHYGRFPEK